MTLRFAIHAVRASNSTAGRVKNQATAKSTRVDKPKKKASSGTSNAAASSGQGAAAAAAQRDQEFMTKEGGIY